MSQPTPKLKPIFENKKPRITFLAMASLGMAILATIALILLLSQGESILEGKDVFGITCHNDLSGSDCNYGWNPGAQFNSQATWMRQGRMMGRAGILFIILPVAVCLLLAMIVTGGFHFLSNISG